MGGIFVSDIVLGLLGSAGWLGKFSQVTGPYIKSGAPILSSGTGWAGPGHCVVLDAGQGHDVTWYHLG